MKLSQKCVFSEKMPRFVAESMKSALFDYSFDSDKVPSLNLNFFCYDYLRTQNLVDAKIMEEGNMLPLCEEFESLVKESAWCPKCVSQSIFSFKTQIKKGRYENLLERKDGNYKDKLAYYRHCAEYIKSLLNSNTSYLELLLDQIEYLVSKDYNYDNCKVLFFCIREYLSELINIGVNKQSLFYRVNKKIFADTKIEKSEKEYLMDFLCSLLPEENEYEVIFGIGDDVHTIFSRLTKHTRPASEDERQALSASYVCHYTPKIAAMDAFDPVSALESAKEDFADLLAAYNLGLHAADFHAKENGLVRKVGCNKFSLIKDCSNPLTRLGTKRKKENEHVLKLMFDGLFDVRMTELFSLHNSALHAQNLKSQFLNLWTIVEVAIDTKQSFACRINYITDVLCPILNTVYYARLVQRLYRFIADDKACRRYLKDSYPEKTPEESFLLCIKNKSEELKPYFNGFLLLEFQIDSLSKLFSSKDMLKNDWTRHNQRIKWQLMRIYRSRCQIVHDGKEPPFLEGIVENLHYYVDEMFDFIILNTKHGMKTLDSIFSAARVKEAEIMNFFEDKNSNIDDETLLNIVLERKDFV